MTYPLQFRPNQSCTILDAGGAPVDDGVDIQLFRPMLGIEMNQLGANLPKLGLAGGAILRFAFASLAGSSLPFGPPNWQSPGIPTFVLNDDPISEHWHIFDAIVWATVGVPIVSGFASKKEPYTLEVNAEGLPPGSPVPSLTTDPIRPGVLYSASFNGLEKKYFVLRMDPNFHGLTWKIITSNDPTRIIKWSIYDGFPGALTLITDSGTAQALYWTGTRAGDLYVILLENTNAGAVDVDMVFQRVLNYYRKA